MAIPPLTDEQLTVVTRPADSRTIVIGGPGSGKTHTIAERVAALLERDETVDAREILVLSFTRAAVAVLRHRLAEHPDAQRLGATTIDAYARALVRRHGGDTHLDFDCIVQHATRLLATEEGPHPRHVIVDEVQDLVEPRLGLIARLIARADGFTVLGDPAQGIYAFRSRDDTDPVRALQGEFPDAVVCSLTRDFRARNPDAALSSARHELLERSPGIRDRLARMLRDTVHVNIEELALVLRHADDGTLVTCRTGGEVLTVSLALHERGVRHRLQTAADAAVPPAWITTMLHRAADEHITRDDFTQLTPDLAPARRAAAWLALTRVAGDRTGDTVTLARVRERITAVEADIPTPEAELPVVSTVHRIKGLEFERVVVLEPSWRDTDLDVFEEARILYVAMTRARCETLMLTRAEPSFAVRRRHGRWLAGPWRSDRVTRMEIRVGDVDRIVPFGDEDGAAVAQRHLRVTVRPGDPVVLERVERYGRTTYAVMHRGLAIAATNAEMVTMLAGLGAAPKIIADVEIAAVSSAAGSPATTEAAGIGDAGLWLVPELTGFGRLV